MIYKTFITEEDIKDFIEADMDTPLSIKIDDIKIKKGILEVQFELIR